VARPVMLRRNKGKDRGNLPANWQAQDIQSYRFALWRATRTTSSARDAQEAPVGKDAGAALPRTTRQACGGTWHR